MVKRSTHGGRRLRSPASSSQSKKRKSPHSSNNEVDVQDRHTTADGSVMTATTGQSVDDTARTQSTLDNRSRSTPDAGTHYRELLIRQKENRRSMESNVKRMVADKLFRKVSIVKCVKP